jgi:N-acetyl-anhydromuramyl-L-alanine amidase AmpD
MMVSVASRLPGKPPKPVKLPDPLPYKRSPNQSARLHGIRPYLLVLHRPVGKYGPSIDWLRNPRARASAHIITEGNNTGVDVATQLVPWGRKAWTQGSFNSASYGIEVDDDAWDGDDLGAAFTAARIIAFLSTRTRIPCEWPSNGRYPHQKPGIYRHYDLGVAGGGHTDPTTDLAYWRWFVRQCQREKDRGRFRSSWGRGRLLRI